jgi:hypothetical protein
MIAKIVNSKVELRKENGVLIRTIPITGAVEVDLSQDEEQLLVTLASGKVELRKVNGILIRTLVNSNAFGARFHGNDVLVKTNSGRMELRKLNGILIRTM